MSDAYDYGRALYMLAEEGDSTERVSEDVKVLSGALAESPAFLRLLDTPAISKEERLYVIDSSLSGLDGMLINLVKILAEKHLSYLLPKALDGYFKAYDEAHGIERAEAVSAVQMTEKQISALKKKLEELTGKTIIIKNTVDPSILGGIKLRYMGIQQDASIKTRLESFEKTLGQIII